METEYFIALEPEKNLFDKILLSKQNILKKYGNQLFLEDLPHCTLYVSVTKDIKKVQNILTNLSNDIFEISMNIQKEYLIFPEDKLANNSSSIGISFDKKSVDEIREVQEKLVNELNLVRSGIPSRYKTVVLNGILSESLEKWGFPFVSSKNGSKILIPHISFCHFSKKEDLEQFKKENSIKSFSGMYKFDKIVLYKLNKDESCEKLMFYHLKRNSKR